MSKKAVILLSGGLDSTTCLAIAKADGYQCYTLSFDYGQKHKFELTAAQKISKQFDVAEHRVITFDLSNRGGSALTDSDISVPTEPCSHAGIPTTYVPARNLIFLSLASGWAEVLEANTLFIGVNAVDYSGYPDCRPEFIQAFEQTVNFATKSGVEGSRFTIKTPLISLSKQQIVELGISLDVDYGQTVTCYQATSEGLACRLCDACRFRAEGFIQAGVTDPTSYLS